MLMNRQSWTFVAILLAALSVAVGLMEHRAIAAHSALAQTSPAASTTFPGHVPIDLARSEAPLFDDPVYHGASDPFVIWNPVKKAWFLYYTQRRATMPNANGVDWVHGSAIAIATSEDGFTWKYLGTCQGDHDLSEPLKAAGKGPEPGLTWWAPCLLYENKMFQVAELELGADSKVVCNRNKYANKESFQQENMARMTQAKQWALAFIMFADAHGNQLPKNLEQAINYVPGLSESNWEIVSGGNFSRSVKPGQTILLREKDRDSFPMAHSSESMPLWTGTRY